MKISSYEVFSNLLDDRGIKLTKTQYDQFYLYYSLLVEWNERVNLTAIIEIDQVFLKHFFDSLSLSFFIPIHEFTTVADIGSGAGFPGVPLKILYPHLKLTIIDSLNKRVQFLNHLTSSLGLSDVNCLHSRAEDAARLNALRDSFDLVTARAVARLSILNELCLPFVKPDGLFVSMKGSDVDSELDEAIYSMQQLNANLIHNFVFELPIEQSKRQILVLKKIGRTPKMFPRKAGLPTKTPLIKHD